MSDEPPTTDLDWRARIRRGPVELMVRDLGVSVRTILLALSRGIAAGQLVKDHPGLCLDDINACVAYAATAVLSAPPLPEPRASEAETLAPSPAVPPDQAPTLAPTVPPAPAGPIHVPGYEILEELGRGGMGVVYKARSIRLERVVALKMILAGEFAGAEMLERFQREAKAAAQLPHPGIAQVYEVGEHDGRPYIVQEFVAGGSLAARLDDKPWPAKKAAELVEAMARAVQTAHEHGIIHRDLKPENVLLTEDSQPKIADFGLAKRMGAEDGKTRTGAILGTPAYMAPEQAAGRTKEIGPAADVYALGAILYRLLTGRPPFLGGDTLALLTQVLEQEPRPVRELNPKAPRDLETIALKCLRKTQKGRYAAAQGLANDLSCFLNGEAIRARPQRAWERWNRWVRRRPGAVALRGICIAAWGVLLLIGRLDLVAAAGMAALTAFALICSPKRLLVFAVAICSLGALVIGTLMWNVPDQSVTVYTPKRLPAPIFFGSFLLAGLLAGAFLAVLRSKQRLYLVGAGLGLLLLVLLILLMPSFARDLWFRDSMDARVVIVLGRVLPATFIEPVAAEMVMLLIGGLLGLVYGSIVVVVERRGGDPVDILCGAMLGSVAGFCVFLLFWAPTHWNEDSTLSWVAATCCAVLGSLVSAYLAGLLTRQVRPAPTH